MEDAARGRGQIRGDGRHDAPGRAGDDEDGVRTEHHSLAAICCGLIFERDRPADSVGVPDLDGSGVVQGLGDENVSDLVRSAAGFEVDGLHQSIRPLADEGFGETGHGATHWRGCTGLVVAVPAAESSRGDEERALERDLLVELPHRGIQQLDP